MNGDTWPDGTPLMDTLAPNDTCPDCGDVLTIFIGRRGEPLGKCLGCRKLYRIKEPTT